MHFDFTSIMDRTGSGALAVDGVLENDGSKKSFAPTPPKDGFDLIPMWVADMNFPVAPSITREIAKRLEHPAFGYYLPSDAFYRSIIDWHRTRHGVTGIAPEHIGYDNGVLGGVVSAVEAFTAPGDAVLVHSPCYIGFTGSLRNIGRRIVESPLKRDAQGVWRMDYDDMERKLADERIHCVVFCSPHNPTGRVWERAELKRAADLFAYHDCVVICDEIWSDLVLGSARHIPFQQISDDARRRTVALYAPSKTFNLAGLVGAYDIIYDSYLRDRVRAQASKSHYNDMNVLWMHALIGAYSDEGAAWLDELRGVLAENVEVACRHIEKRWPEVDVARPQGTYMLFLNCARWCEARGVGVDELLRAGWDVGVAWQDGRPFGGQSTVRMNLALPTSRVIEAFSRLDEHVFCAK